MEKGTKNDSDKLRFDLVPAYALQEVTKVITYGEAKYPSVVNANGTRTQNWKLLDNANQRLFAAVQRHLWQYQAGEILDSETGISHLAHACSSLLFMIELDKMQNVHQIN